jgi:prepilin-type N-terminal cleavage/methylation domain-containing protein
MIATKDNGITLVELLIVISIVCILAVALGFEYADWVGRYRVETQIREMHLDLMDARVRAMLRRRAHFVSLAQTHYKIQEDIYPWPDGDRCLTASDSSRPAGYNEPIPLLKKDLYRDLPLTWNNIRVSHIRFNARGFSNTNRTICVNTDKNADYDCIAISAARIRLGRLKKKIPDGGICNSENCVMK